MLLRYFSIALVVMCCCSCARLPVAESGKPVEQDTFFVINQDEDPMQDLVVVVQHDITVKKYFAFMDSIVARYDTLPGHILSEHILVRVNPRIIDTLASFDYYKLIEQGIFIYDQRDLVVLHQGDSIRIPDASEIAEIQDRLNHTVIDVNIPEFKLRIIERDSVKYTFCVRVGRNESKYLKTAQRVVSLKTPIGEGEIVRVERNPIFVNPVTGERYTSTKRDDERYTMMPQIPWLEPAIEGKRFGSLIHPTTNPKTLDKAYSNGCVGTGEGDAWIIYYHAPVGTKVNFRYELDVKDENGNPVKLKDIYKLGEVGFNPDMELPEIDPFIEHEFSECH